MYKLFGDRCAMYSFIARLFREAPDEVFMGHLKQINYSIYENLVSETELGFGQMGIAIAQSGESVIKNLQSAYKKTFLTGDLAVYPCESVYNRPIQGYDAADDVITVYAMEGFIKSNKYREPADHISFELEFMAILCDRADHCSQINDLKRMEYYMNKIETFLSTHLLNWAFKFAEDVENIAENDFYKGAAKVLRGFLLEEKSIIQNVS